MADANTDRYAKPFVSPETITVDLLDYVHAPPITSTPTPPMAPGDTRSDERETRRNAMYGRNGGRSRRANPPIIPQRTL